MSFLNNGGNDAQSASATPSEGLRLIPHITMQAFCENSQTAQLIESALSDRRMAKVALTTHNGSVQGAIETYRTNPTPNLIVVETSLSPDQIPPALDELAEF